MRTASCSLVGSAAITFPWILFGRPLINFSTRSSSSRTILVHNMGGNSNGDGNGNRGGNGNGNHNENDRDVRPVIQECTYQDFMKCQPLNLKGSEGVIGLIRTMTNTRSRMTPTAIKEMINRRVAEALEARKANRNIGLGNDNDKGGNSNGDGNGNR
nr:hypothetical protein [Tanacetum cinerariifolium]